MPTLPKRKPEKARAPLVPAWHPNFRNFQRLPDTKPVRTVFFINGLAVVVALVVLLFVAYQEYALFTVNRQIAELEAQIERDQKLSRQAVTLFKQFEEEEKKILDLETFLRRPVAMSDLMLDIGRTLPNRIALRSVAYRDTGVIIRGMVRGAGDRASGEVSTYVEQLRRDRVFAALFGNISQTSLARDPQSGRMTFELFLKFKSAPAPASK
jgi:hypothetical protein